MPSAEKLEISRALATRFVSSASPARSQRTVASCRWHPARNTRAAWRRRRVGTNIASRAFRVPEVLLPSTTPSHPERCSNGSLRTTLRRFFARNLAAATRAWPHYRSNRSYMRHPLRILAVAIGYSSVTQPSEADLTFLMYLNNVPDVAL